MKSTWKPFPWLATTIVLQVLTLSVTAVVLVAAMSWL